MRLRAHVREVSDDGPWVWTWWEAVVTVGVAAEREKEGD